MIRFGILFALLLVTPAVAQGQAAPPAVRQAISPETVSDDLQTCLRQTGDYVTRSKVIVYVIGITNTCEKRLRCEVFANVTGARGSAVGHTIMILGPASNDAAAKKSYEMKVKAAGGIAQVSRECRAL
jgi:hypothetical protein